MRCNKGNQYVSLKDWLSLSNEHIVNIQKDWGTRWRSWLRHCAASRKVTGSIPDGVPMALGLIQSLTEMSTRNISWGVKAAGA